MCRSKSEGGQRCGCDSSAARQSRRVAERVRSTTVTEETTTTTAEEAASTVVEQEAPPSLEDTKEEVDTVEQESVPPSLEAIKEEAKQVAKIVEKMRNDEVTHSEAEQAVTSLGESISRRVDADTYDPELENKLAAIEEQKEKSEKEAKELLDRFSALNSERKSLNNQLLTKQLEEKDFYEKWNKTTEEAKNIDKERKDLLTQRRDIMKGVSDHKSKLADAYRNVLGEIRGMGGKAEGLSPKSHKKNVSILQSSLENFPSEWIDETNRNTIPLRVKNTTSRAHYAHQAIQKDSKQFTAAKTVFRPKGWTPPEDDPSYVGWQRLSDSPNDPDAKYYMPDSRRSYYKNAEEERGSEVWIAPDYDTRMAVSDTPPKGRGWEKVSLPGKYLNSDGTHSGDPQTVWRRERGVRHTVGMSRESELTVSTFDTTTRIRDKGYDVATHEFSHRVESSLPHITDLEESFLKRRTTLPNGEREKLQRYNGSGRKLEIVRPDSFADRYMGKEYSRSNHREVLSTGTEALFAGSFGGLVGLDNYKEDKDMRNFVLGTLASS